MQFQVMDKTWKIHAYFRYQTSSIMYLPAHHSLSKRAETPVVCLFDVIRETAGGQFLHAQMILDTFTTRSLA
jgi:hypothetical protein